MKKKIFLAIILLVMLASTGIVYLNKVFLPTKIKSLIVDNLQKATQKKVSLESVRFNIFKGLVLRNFKIYDDKENFLILKEGSCNFLILPIFKKRIIIPSLRLRSPEIFLERRRNNTFNVQDLFPKKTTRVQEAKFALNILKISISDASIHFQDHTFSTSFSKNIEDVDLILRLSLPASIKFNLSASIPVTQAIKINASGEYRVPEKQLTAKFFLNGFSPKEFSNYYQDWGILVQEGLIDILGNLKFKADTLSLDLETQSKNLKLVKEKISATINSGIKANISYNLKDKQPKFSGRATIAEAQVSGLELIENISNISGEVSFENSGFSSDRLNASILGLPIQSKLKLTDFNRPLLAVEITSKLGLDSLKGILKDRFKFQIPGELKGEGDLSLAIQARLPVTQIPQVDGALNIKGATLKLDRLNLPLEEINGRLEFNLSQLKWQQFSFKYLGTPYKTEGILTNFQAPGVQLILSSKDIFLESAFNFNPQYEQARFSKCAGRYLNSGFSFTGNVNIQDPAKPEVDLSADLKIDLQDIKEPLNKFKAQLEKIKPLGLIQAQGNINGNINNIKTCAIAAQLSSPALSLYGLKAREFLLNYSQANGLADIPLLHLSLYSGTIEGAAKINLNSESLPYWVTMDMQGVKLEELKEDTAVKGEDLAGTIAGQLKLDGLSDDISRINGAGKVNITEGKLWQLNLFKGLGSLLFAKDFASIVFNEGSCDFSIQDRYVFTDNLKLKSNITDLDGAVKIGFDSSIDATLNVHVLDEMAPVTGTLKDLTTAIIGQAGRFGVIKVSGTLKEPKYKFQPAVVDILKSLKEAIFGQ